MRSDSTFSRESSCVLDVRSLVMSYKFVLICFNLLLILFAHIFLLPWRFAFFFFLLCFRKRCMWSLVSLFRVLLAATCQCYLKPGTVTELKTTAVFWRGPSMAIFLIERGGAAVFSLKWRLQKFLYSIGLSATHSSHKPGLNPSPELYLLII